MDDKKKTSMYLTEQDRARIAKIQRKLVAERREADTEPVTMVDAIRYALLKVAGNGDKPATSQ